MVRISVELSEYELSLFRRKLDGAQLGRGDDAVLQRITDRLKWSCDHPEKVEDAVSPARK